ncbi:hypothetical protein C3731_20010 [Brucella oryzae]|uniref:Uncharacterized protein n=1 Tax=Brucella oryzae TaxID=335286 RepID=A0A2S7IUW0_9HYPH|nr:hypothetical protein C3731_20010 [Brucella oryzae]
MAASVQKARPAKLPYDSLVKAMAFRFIRSIREANCMAQRLERRQTLKRLVRNEAASGLYGFTLHA